MTLTSTAGRRCAILLFMLAAGPARADGNRVREATCTKLSSCTVPIQISSSQVSFPRQLSCIWTPSDVARGLRRVVIMHQPLGLPSRLMFAVPVNDATQTSFALKEDLQSVDLLSAKSGNLNVTFEWNTPVTVTVLCNLAYTN